MNQGERGTSIFFTPNPGEQGVSLMKRNGGTVLVGMPPSGVAATIPLGWLAADGQKILGSKMGSARPLIDVPKIAAPPPLRAAQGRSAITGRVPLERINDAVASSRSGAALRNAIVF